MTDGFTTFRDKLSVAAACARRTQDAARGLTVDDGGGIPALEVINLMVEVAMLCGIVTGLDELAEGMVFKRRK